MIAIGSGNLLVEKMPAFLTLISSSIFSSDGVAARGLFLFLRSTQIQFDFVASILLITSVDLLRRYFLCLNYFAEAQFT